MTAGAAGDPAPPVLHYGGDEAFAPFESLDAEGRPRGFQIDLLSALAEVPGLRFAPRLQPWTRTEADFRAGRLDLVAMVETRERQTCARFLRGHATPSLGLVHRRERAPLQGLPELQRLRLAVPDAAPMRDTLQHLAGVVGPLVWRPDAGRVLDAVQQGEADVALLPRAYADPLIAARPGAGLVIDHVPLPLQTYGFAVAPERADLQAVLQQGLDRLEASGRLEALRVRWLSSHRDLAVQRLLRRDLDTQRAWTWGSALAGGALAAGLGAVAWQRGRRAAQERQRRRAAEAALQRAEALLDQAFTRQPDAMMLVDRSARTLRDANPALAALLGVPLARLLGQPLDTLGAHLDPCTLARLARALADGQAVQGLPLRVRREDGDWRDTLISIDTLVIEGSAHAFAVAHDISDQLARDAELRRSYDELLAQQQADARVAVARAEAAADAAAGQAAAARSAQAEAEARLNDFTRTVAHDLRTPLNVVTGFAGLLRQRLRDGRLDEAETCSLHIQQAAQRMASMISALQRLAQVGRQPLQRATVRMQRLAEDSAALWRAAEPGWQVDLRVDPLPDVTGDAELLAQVWQNLIGNAMKYSARAAAPRVRVDSHQDERGTWYRITDNGIGFDMAQAGRLFQPFQRLDTARGFEGSGIGLSLVQRIIRLHGGEVRLRSAPGIGTVAEFTVDADPAAAAAPPAGP